MLELKPNPTATASRPRTAPEAKQPRRLMLALVLLLVALAGVVIKDRQFWFGSDESLDVDVTAPAVSHPASAKSVPTQRPTPTPTKKQAAVAKNSTAPKAAEPKTEDVPAVATTRTVLAPLDVEVVAGDNHRVVRPGSNAAKVEITNPATQSAADFGSATKAAERERMSVDATPSYPLLAQHMNVQGSVVLQAVIGADGIIQNLRVLSGPGILTPAAQQAVREWRFKPIMQNGQAVESKAKITVNFSIKVADGNTKTTLAETRMDDIRIITR